MALPDSMSEYSAMDDNTYIMPYGEFIDRNTWTFDPDARYNDQPYTAAAAAAADVPYSSHGSSVANAGDSRYPTPMPPSSKRRKYDTHTNRHALSAALGVVTGVSTEKKTVNDAPADEKMTQIESPDGQTPPHRRERHIRASARNWQKQKLQSAD
ncbi:hypothetical protein LZ30DRAFT_787115 [Colletotrichum cereale]|nr:hypothetical protein LZ30DRAFT_787115 [Colletotrichum cereale]